jgi:hypothetical protein
MPCPPGQTDEGRGSGREGRGLVGTEIRQRGERGLAPRGVANAQQLQQRVQQPRPRREAVALFRAAERRVGDRRRRTLLRRRRRTRERRRERVRHQPGARELPRPAWRERDVAQARSCRLAGRRAAVEQRARQRLVGRGGGRSGRCCWWCCWWVGGEGGQGVAVGAAAAAAARSARDLTEGSSVLGPGRSGAADLHGPRLGRERGGGAPVRVQGGAQLERRAVLARPCKGGGSDFTFRVRGGGGAGVT